MSREGFCRNRISTHAARISLALSAKIFRGWLMVAVVGPVVLNLPGTSMVAAPTHFLQD